MKKIQKSFELKAPLVRDKKRYLCGIATGLKHDAHGERMSGNCIRSISRQSRKKDVLLFPDEHGIRESQNSGILHNLKQLPNGDVYVEFRLYDDTDAVQSIDVANTLWAQANGLPPYTKPRAKGFSIEGYIPEDREDLEDKRDAEGIIDDMKVEGFVVVPEPAYKQSVIKTVEKSKSIAKEQRMAKKVKKAMTPEEEDIVAQIEEQIARLREIAQGESGADDIIEEVAEGDDVPLEDEELGGAEVEEDAEGLEADEAEADEFAEPDTEEDEVLKKKVKKSETGRASADEKLNTLEPGDERALQVLKSLFTRVQKAERVPKETIKYFQETHRVMKSLFGKVEQQQRQIHDLESSVTGMLEGMGVTDKTLASPKRRIAKSRLSPDAQALVEAFGSAIQKAHYPQGHERNTRFDTGAGESLGDGRRSLIRKALDSSIGAGEGPFSPLIAQKLKKVITNVVTRLSPELAVIKTEYAPQKFHEFNRLMALPKPNGFMGEGAATPTHQSFYTRDKVDLKVLRRKGAVTNFLQDASKGYIDAAAAEMENHLQSHAYDIITALLWGHAKANKYSVDGLDALIETNRENKALGGEVPQSLAFLDDMIDQNIEKQGAAHNKCYLKGDTD